MTNNILRRLSISRNNAYEPVPLDNRKTTRKHKSKTILKPVLLIMFTTSVLYLLYRLFHSNSSAQDLSTSKHCKTPYMNKPLLEHVIIIDAGSTGSRIHIYTFNNCLKKPILENEVFEQIKPGLSSYSDAAESAGSLVKLMEVAMSRVPNNKRECTPLMIKATAGLRLLGKEKSDNILKEVRSLVKKYPFPILNVNDNEGISILEGELEGVYAWITVNYLLDRNNNKFDSVATLDLGGGSTQIVFEPNFMNYSNTNEMVKPYRYELELNNNNHILYQNSYLGYGLMEARKKVKLLLISETNNKAINDPCFSNDKKEIHNIDNTEYTTTGNSDGISRCQELVTKIFNLDKQCSYKTCSFNNVYQPDIKKTFVNDIYAFSYFYDRLHPLGLSPKTTLNQIKLTADNVCKNNYEYFKNIKGAIEELQNNPNRCLDLTFIYTLLNNGYKINKDKTIITMKKIKGYETGWSLGAALTSLGKLKCKIIPNK